MRLSDSQSRVKGNIPTTTNSARRLRACLERKYSVANGALYCAAMEVRTTIWPSVFTNSGTEKLRKRGMDSRILSYVREYVLDKIIDPTKVDLEHLPPTQWVFTHKR